MIHSRIFDSNREGFSSMITRVRYFLDQAEKSTLDVVVIYGHAIYFSALVALLAGAHPKSRKDLLFRFDYCSITTLKYDKGKGWSLSGLNNTNHLSC
ncbi:Hypothetical protein HVR_LOCUS980 [uncultured virus]|nr:Hypothetical protein HVR_LOCUS980 [uncultured virus]